MNKHPKDLPVLVVPAFLWDGVKQLSGELVLTTDAVKFQFKDFQKSQLELNIPITKINKVEEFLLFDLERKGLKIISNTDKEDQFISENTKQFKEALEKIIFPTKM